MLLPLPSTSSFRFLIVLSCDTSTSLLPLFLFFVSCRDVSFFVRHAFFVLREEVSFAVLAIERHFNFLLVCRFFLTTRSNFLVAASSFHPFFTTPHNRGDEFCFQPFGHEVLYFFIDVFEYVVLQHTIVFCFCNDLSIYCNGFHLQIQLYVM